MSKDLRFPSDLYNENYWNAFSKAFVETNYPQGKARKVAISFSNQVLLYMRKINTREELLSYKTNSYAYTYVFFNLLLLSSLLLNRFILVLSIFSLLLIMKYEIIYPPTPTVTIA